MSAVLNTPSPSARQVPMQTLVVGRIEHSSRHDGKTTTRIICPSGDDYIAPGSVPVRSKSSIGAVGDQVSVMCRVGGYKRKPFKVTDNVTGEIRMVTESVTTLDLIE